MSGNMKGRSFLKLLDFSPAEIQDLLELAASLKKAKKNGSECPKLAGQKYSPDF